MNKTFKHIVAILVGLVMMAGGVAARTVKAPAPVQEAVETVLPAAPINFIPNTACYLPDQHLFVVIDSVDCAVDVLVNNGDAIRAIGRFTTDVYQGRHDIKNIIRPKSVMISDNNIIVLASSQVDTSYVAVFDINAIVAMSSQEVAEIKPVAQIGFSSTSFAFQFADNASQLIVMGKNAVGYDINTIDFAKGIQNISPATTFHYHVPKQSERIQDSDPHGWGLAIVAIIVVFFALVCICFIMKGYGNIIRKVSERKPDSKIISSAEGGDVYAAIAAALYCYEEEQHDEEETVITIQKVERAWTPWNAKFYNMNQFFTKR